MLFVLSIEWYLFFFFHYGTNTQILAYAVLKSLTSQQGGMKIQEINRKVSVFV